MALTIRVRSTLGTLRNSFAAVALILVEQPTPDLIPVQHRIARFAEPIDGYREIVEVFEAALDGLVNDFRPAALYPPPLPPNPLPRRAPVRSRSALSRMKPSASF